MLSLLEPIHAGSLAGNVGKVLALSAGAKSHVCAYQVKHLFSRIPGRTQEQIYALSRFSNGFTNRESLGARRGSDGRRCCVVAEQRNSITEEQRVGDGSGVSVNIACDIISCAPGLRRHFQSRTRGIDELKQGSDAGV
jgi:hypothetical protein